MGKGSSARVVASHPGSSRIWYCARLTAEQIAAGHVEIIRRRFSEAVARAGAPEGACVFATSHDTRSARLHENAEDEVNGDADAVFFSPASISAVPELISEYGAEPSEPPRRTRAALLVGDEASWDLLARSSH